MACVVVTGCNRGIGLELVRQFTERGDTVVAVCRAPGDALRNLDARIIAGVDVGDAKSVPRLREAIGDKPIDILVNNAGILRADKLGNIDYEQMIEHFRINSLGPLRVTETLLENLHRGSKIAIITSRVGSIADNSSGGYYAYRASKTAVNQIGVNLKHDLEPRGIAVILLHPGLVATDMTGGQGIPPEEAARGLIARIDALDLDRSGSFWHAEGYELPW